ncbi:alpha/beta fold hydrolase [Nocardia sp. CA-129566]|uniref:alpha/beta fold hydrolase n=1 Tax=Nocardia sp. CA-129566 TaxID=3239976 RepID=UPI003D95CE7B
MTTDPTTAGPRGAGTAATSLVVPAVLGDVALRLARHPDAGSSAVLLLHANPGDSRDFDAVLPVLASEHTVATVDWPGYGKSTAHAPETITAASLVNVAAEVLDTLSAHGIERVSIIGNSVGGYVAVRLAQLRPDVITSLVLVDPGGFTRQNPLTRAACRSVLGRPAIARHLVGPMARAYLGRLSTPSARETYRRTKAIKNDRARLAVYSSVWRSFADPAFDLSAPAEGVSVPTLLIWGRRDPVVSSALDGRRARRAIPHAKWVSLPTGHEPYNERPAAFLEHVVPFLREHAGGQRQRSDEE